MPAVTEFSKPNGEPIATTHWPAFSFGIAELHHRQVLAFDLEHRDVGPRIGADHLGGEFTAIGQPHEDFVRVGDHVGVGEDVAVRRS